MSDILYEEKIREAALLEAAAWVSEPSMTDLSGIMSRKKRVREDSALRAQTAKETRQRCADLILARLKNGVGSQVKRLAAIKAGAFTRCMSDMDLAAAIFLAHRGLCVVSAEIKIGHGYNTVPPRVQWSVSLTEKGEAELEAAGEAMRDE